MARRTLVLAGLATAGALVLPATAPAAVVSSGTLTNDLGVPSRGEVRVYADLETKGRTVSPLVGKAAVGPDGTFSVRAAHPRRLAGLAAGQNGWVDLATVAETATHTGQWITTVRVRRTPGGGVVVQGAREGFTAVPTARAAAAATRPGAITVRADQLKVRTFQTGRCQNRRERLKTQTRRALVVVGELNNAYSDGTRARFDYAREGHAETAVGIAHSADGGNSFSIGGQKTVTNEGTIGFAPFTTRRQRRMRTQFEFTRRGARNNTCAKFDIEVKATSWIGGANTKMRQHGALGKCDSRQLEGYPAGTLFQTRRATAARYTKGVSVFGVSLTSTSGFSENVKVSHRFGGRGGRRHWLCGPDGKQSPFEASRVFSGAR